MTYGVIGMIAGVVIGSYLGVLMAQAIDEPFGTFVDGFSLSPSGILIGVVMGLVVPFLAAIVPVFLGTRVTILQAMTDVDDEVVQPSGRPGGELPSHRG